MIVLQNKIIADWFAGRRFMWAISMSVAAYPIGVGLAQLVLPPLALAYGWQAAFLSDAAAHGRARWCCSSPATAPRRMTADSRAPSRCRAGASACCW